MYKLIHRLIERIEMVLEKLDLIIKLLTQPKPEVLNIHLGKPQQK